MPRSLRILLLPLLLFLPVPGAASYRPPESGTPFVRNFLPRDYGADSQNWAVAQNAQGLVYVANNSGVLEYDGVRWRLITTAKGQVVRSLAVGPDGKIYVGSVGVFGVLERDGSGQLAFTQLSRNLKICPEFSDVWVTAATPRGVLFQTREAMFLLEDGGIRELKATTTFHTSFVVDGRIFVRQREVGLEEVKDGRLALVPGGERFKQESVFAMVSLDDRKGPGGILVGSRHQGLFRLGEGQLRPFPTLADGFLKANALYHGTRLQDGTVALATLRGGLLFLAPDGKLVGVLNHALGLLGDEIKFVCPGRGQTAWLALDTGVAQLEWPPAFTTFNERLGLSGQVWDVLRHDGRIYAATGQGAFLLDEAPTPLPHAAFRPIPGIASQCSALLSVDGDLLAACGEGVLAIRGGRALPVLPSSNNAISFLPSRRDPSRVFVGALGALLSLRRERGSALGWKPEGMITEVTDGLYTLEEEPDGTLWAGTGSDKVLRVRFPSGWRGGPDPRIQVDRFGAEQGLLGASSPIVASVGGTLVVGTRQGLFSFKEPEGRFAPDPRFHALFPGGGRWITAIREDAQGRIWLVAADDARGTQVTGFARFSPAGVEWNPSPFQRLGANAVQVVWPEKNGVVWFGGSGGLERFDPGFLSTAGSSSFVALIRKVTTGKGRPLAGGGQAAILLLPMDEGRLRFEFSAPDPGVVGGVQYQVRLDGYDRDWSAWSVEPQKEYTGLVEGRYVFQVRARDAQGEWSAPASFPFQVRPPLRRTWWAFLLYAVTAAFAVQLLLRARTRLLRQRNTFLHARITEATWEIREREKRLEAQAADLARVNLDLLDINRQKGEILEIVAHDLRNPLNGIVLSAELILEAEDLETIHKRARKVLKSSEEMNGLLALFLDLAAIDGGRIQPDPERLDLEIVILEAVMRFRDAARAKNILLDSVLPEAGATAWADRRFLGEVLDNLLSNAIKFSGADTRVILRVEPEADKVRISVEDQGPGLTSEDKVKLFSRFAKLSARPTAGESSVGLGLSIAKALVEYMGGRIWAESEPGQGTAFRVELPRTRSA